MKIISTEDKIATFNLLRQRQPEIGLQDAKNQIEGTEIPDSIELYVDLVALGCQVDTSTMRITTYGLQYLEQVAMNDIIRVATRLTTIQHILANPERFHVDH